MAPTLKANKNIELTTSNTAINTIGKIIDNKITAIKIRSFLAQ